MNTLQLKEPHRGLDNNPKGDIATIMQAWYIQTGVMELSEAERLQRPIVANAEGKTISTERILMLLRAMAVLYNIDPSTVRIHGLRKGAITGLANGPEILSGNTMLSITGHKDIKTTQGYVLPGPGMAKAATIALERIRK
jgi:site-specific recombinase XerD